MKSLLFVFIVFFIQLGFSQDILSEKLVDTITIDNKFIKQLDDRCVEKSGFLRTSPVDFKIDSTKLFFNKRAYYKINTNVLFYNKTKDLIIIKDIKGGSNYVTDTYDLVLLPNKQKIIKMSFASSKGYSSLTRVFQFIVNRPKEEEIQVYRKHVFEFIGE